LIGANHAADDWEGGRECEERDARAAE